MFIISLLITYIVFLLHCFPLPTEGKSSAPVVPNIDKIDLCNTPSLEEVSGVDANQFCIEHDNITRCWYLYIPDSVVTNSSSPIPLVLDLHGYNLCASMSANYTGWNRIAEQHAFMVVWPQGNLNAKYSNDPSWDFGACCSGLGESENEGEMPPPADINDVDFLIQLIANVVDYSANEKNITVDTKRLYFGGHSNGCIMAQAMAALRSDVVSAVCCHAANALAAPESSYLPTPVQVIYGDLDFFLQMDFGFPVLEFWGPINQCPINDTVIDQSGLYATHTLSNCADNVEVETVELYNVGHYPYLDLPPDNRYTISEYPGAVTPTIDTTLLAWEFCSAFESDAEPILPEPVALVAADEYFTAQAQSTPPSSSAFVPSFNLVASLIAVHFIHMLAI